MALGDRILQALKDAGISQAEIARRLDVTPQAVNGWITTDTISKKNLARLAKETGADLHALMEEREQVGAAERSAAADYMPRPRKPQGVPIIGFAIATPNEDGFFDEMYLAPGTSDEFVEFGTKDPDAYALRVRGDSMRPRIRPDEIIVVEPNKRLVQGGDVLVRTKAGRKMVKQLLFQRADAVTLGSINESYPQLTLALEEVESIHATTPARAATGDKVGGL